VRFGGGRWFVAKVWWWCFESLRCGGRRGKGHRVGFLPIRREFLFFYHQPDLADMHTYSSRYHQTYLEYCSIMRILRRNHFARNYPGDLAITELV
jgi:hypothetical protein